MRALRRVLLLTVCAALLTATTPSANAGDALNPCQGQALSRPFLPWLDVAQYTLAPNGALEQGTTGWKLSGGASLVSGNETFAAHGAGDTMSLQLPPGSSATTSELCVSLLHPTLRLFVRNSGSPLATVRVEVLSRSVLGLRLATPIGVLTGTSAWQPTLPMLILDNLTALPLLTNGTTQVAFRFTPLESSSGFTIDDLYVDPYQGR